MHMTFNFSACCLAANLGPVQSLVFTKNPCGTIVMLHHASSCHIIALAYVVCTQELCNLWPSTRKGKELGLRMNLPFEDKHYAMHACMHAIAILLVLAQMLFIHLVVI